eukprot:m.454365 g.454365  ORF g.454365 m.454365 type:complete len:433 (+) comp20653_c0_seq1:190-1488(+)
MRHFQLLVALCVMTGCGAEMFGKDSTVLTPTNMKEKVLDSDLPWIVGFYAPWCGHCKNLAGPWAKVATATKGIVQFGQVDADTHKSLAGQYGVQGFPTIKLFGSNKKSPQDYQGQRDVQGLAQAALKLASEVVSDRLGGGGGGGSSGGSSAVVQLTDQSFDKTVLESKDLWAVAFVAPWCGYCKKLEPEWISASGRLKGIAKLGQVDATANQMLAQKYGVQSYPTIKVFPSGGPKSGDAEDFEGGRTASDIVTYMEEKALESAPAPEVVQLTGQSVLDECGAKQLCFIAVLPLLQDSGKDGRNGYIDTLKESAEKYKRRPFGWIWSEGTVQASAETSLEVGGFGYPALVALNAKKGKFGTMRGQFSGKGVAEFVNKLVAGRQPTVSLSTNLTIVDAPAWDGGEFVPEVIEEEFDLSDLDDVDLDDEPTKDEL